MKRCYEYQPSIITYSELFDYLAEDIILRNFSTFYISIDKLKDEFDKECKYFTLHYNNSVLKISNKTEIFDLKISELEIVVSDFITDFRNRINEYFTNNIKWDDIRKNKDIHVTDCIKINVIGPLKSNKNDSYSFLIYDENSCDLFLLDEYSKAVGKDSIYIPDFIEKAFENNNIHYDDSQVDATAGKRINTYYRGQLLKYSLLPSLFRYNTYIENEAQLNANIVCSRPSDFDDCPSTFDKLVKLKHYELPSRLMDITTNPLIALYFACESAADKGEYGVVYEYYSDEDEEKYSPISDTVTLLSAVTNSTHRRGFTKRFIEDKPIKKTSMLCERAGCCTKNKCIKNKNKVSEQYICEHFLGEIGYQAQQEVGLDKFWDDLTYNSLDTAIVVHAPLNNIRITHQQGLFIMCGFNQNDFYSPPDKYYKFYNLKETLKSVGVNGKNRRQKIYYFSSDVASKILEELKLFGIDQYYIYSELDKNIKTLKKSLGYNY